MSAGKTALKAAGITIGVAAGVAGGAYAAQRAVARSLRHRPDPDAGRLGPLVFDEERRFPSHDGGSIYVARKAADPRSSAQPDRRSGQNAPPIVLVHGVTLASRVWVKQFESLPRAGFPVIAVDERGHGESIAGDTGHSVENLGLDLRTVLEALDLRDAIVVGHSMGGIAVEELAIRHPEVVRDRVRGVVLLSTLARTPLSGSRRIRVAAEKITGAVAVGTIMSRPDLGTMLARIGFGREPLASHVELTRELLATCDADTSREAVGALLGLDLTGELPLIDVPTLVIGGTADVITPPAESKRIAELIPGARLVLFENAGHMLMLERAEEFERLVIEFARELEVLERAS